MLSKVKYPKENFKKGAVKRKTFNLTDSSGSNNSGQGEMIAQLKGKFHITGKKKSEKVQIFIVLPKSLSIRKIQQEFKDLDYMVRTTRKLVTEKGILSSPDVKPGKCCLLRQLKW
jgi:hypothetical protein